MMQVINTVIFSFTSLLVLAAFIALYQHYRTRGTMQQTLLPASGFRQSLKEILKTVMRLLGLENKKSAQLCKVRLNECCSRRRP